MEQVKENINSKPIEGYENYQITTDGEVINSKTGRILKKYDNGIGYLFVILSKNNEHKKFYVHRLVAEAFIPNIQYLPEINHMDEDKQNNNVDNLEWCTHRYNCNYGTRNERTSKLTSKPVMQLTKDGELVRIWKSATEAEKQARYSHGNICTCCNGKRHTAYGYIWRYFNIN